MKNHSVQYMRRRRFLLVFPLLTVPFVTGLLWAVDDMGKDKKKTEQKKESQGLDPELPGAHFKDDRRSDKMDFYTEAELDSVKKEQQSRSEDFYGRRLERVPSPGESQDSTIKRQGEKLPGEEKIDHKLRALDGVLHTAPVEVAWPEQRQRSGLEGTSVSSAGMERLEQMMQRVKEDKEDKGDIREMSEVLDKLIRVQHPELLRDSLQQPQKGKAAPPVLQKIDVGSVSVLESEMGSERSMHASMNQFYGLPEAVSKDTAGNVLEAMVPESQTLMSGSTIQLQLMEEVVVSGVAIPAGTSVYGLASLNNERLNVVVRSIRYGDHLLPVELHVYDEDGLEGIYIPGAIGRDVVKQSADQGLNGLNLGTFDPSVAGQAASAGMQLARNMVSRKIRQVKVMVDAGYRVWLRDSKAN